VGAELVAEGSPSIADDDLTFLGMPVLLFTPHVVPTGPMGEMSLEVDFDNLPPGISIVAGDTWGFQLWYRDLNQAQQNAGGQQRLDSRFRSRGGWWLAGPSTSVEG
jgi:hypothetical protein